MSQPRAKRTLGRVKEYKGVSIVDKRVGIVRSKSLLVLITRSLRLEGVGLFPMNPFCIRNDRPFMPAMVEEETV